MTRIVPFARGLVAVAVVTGGSAACHRPAPPPPPAERQWQLLASELPSALLSVSARSPHDVYAVGADKGHGPYVLHFDGAGWSTVATGQTGDLWWVQALPDATLMGGAGGMVLRVRPHDTHVERVSTPGLSRQTVYGVWGVSGDDFYAVGSAGGRNGFVWHFEHGAVHEELLPLDLPRTAAGEVPGFFKVWGAPGATDAAGGGTGTAAEVWVVGGAGAILHRRGSGPFEVVPSGTRDTLFTVAGVTQKGAPGHLLTVGGAGNGVLLQRGAEGPFANLSPPGAGLLQGVFATAAGDWASGERGAVYTRPGTEGPFTAVEHGLALPATSSLHSITVDAAGGVWSAGGNVLGPALDGGMLVHYGAPVPTVVLADETPLAAGPPSSPSNGCPVAVVAAGRQGSIARRWNEQALAAIRLDLPRPTVHARNLFHLAAAMWDAWAAYDATPGGPQGLFVKERVEVRELAAETLQEARRRAISHAAYGVLASRYAHAVGGARTMACLRAVMADLGDDPDDTHDEARGAAGAGGDPVAFGNRIAQAILASTEDDGANAADDYRPKAPYASLNTPLVYDAAGGALADPSHWQPINLSVAATQNGIILPAGVQAYIGAQWGDVRPFALKRASSAVPWVDPGPAPTLGPAMNGYLVEVIRKTAAVDVDDPTTLDASPGALGHNSLGANDGHGWVKNPVTGEPYAPQVVMRCDFARVMAEFWADGPKSETPPGHWNTLANSVSDTPGFSRRLFGRGPSLDPLAWDVHVYFALNAAEHDAAIAAWDVKRRTTTVRPISLIRWMGGKGQSTDPHAPSYDPQGLPLVPGLIEVITKESSAPGQRHERLAFFEGQVAVRNWLGEPGDPASRASGAAWVRAVDWIPYQRRTFVTPAFPAFISGHSTFSRAGAEVLAGLTGSPYFPGGLGEFVAHKDTFLTFEKGPMADVRLQWASYYDASDEAGQSRLWGSIHIAADDFAGRRVGSRVGLGALARATTYFEKASRAPAF